MSRRKQAHPSRHLDAEDGPAAPTASAAAATTSTLPNGESSCSASDDDGAGTESGAQDGGMSDSGGSRLMQQSGEERTCGLCHGEFPNLTAFLAHKVSCNKQDEDMGSSEEDEDLKRVGGELRRRRLQDAENNNGALGHSGHEKDEFEDYEETAKSMASVMNLAPLLNLVPGAPPNPAAAAAMAAAAAAIPGAASLFPGLGGSTVTLEALQNTKVAVAQFAATALANNANNPAALQELAVLQSTLYTLQHQQMLQLNLIQQLQQQLQISRGSKEGSPVSPASIPRMQQDDILTPPSPPISIPSSLPLSSANIPLQHHPPSLSALERQAEARLTEARHESRHESRHHIESRHERIMPERQQAPLTPSCLDRQQGTAVPATVLKQPQVTCTSSLGTTTTTPRLSLGVEPLPPSKPTPSTTPRIPSPPTSSCNPSVTMAPSISSSVAPLNIPPHPLHHQTGGGVTGCSISASLAASIITNTDPLPSSDEPNSLEMLQRRAQEVLDSASQGLLAGNLADELAFRGGAGKGGSGKSGDGKRGNEPFFKHRCRYCGKVFGSDSALQIHIRSHTGERPFKCNVCGSRFTTKGNLKVHFQRHTAKFPHIKMNPNPVPEHLDKYHPPLLAQLQQSQSSSTSPPTTIPPHPAQNLPTLPPFPPPPAPPHLSQTFRPSLPPSHPLMNNKLSIPSPHPTTLSIPSIPAQQRLQQLVPPPSLPPPPPLHQFLPEQDVPENLSKPAPQSSPLPRPSHTISTSEPSSPMAAPQMQVKSEASDEESGVEDECGDEDEEADRRLHPMDLDVKHEVSDDSSPPPPPTSAPPSYRDEDEDEQAPLEMDEEMEDSLGGGSSRAGDFCSDEEEDELLAATSASPGVPLQDCEDSQEQPENLSKSSPPTISNSQTNTFLSNHSASSHGQRLPASYPFLGAVSPHSSTSSTGNNPLTNNSYSDHTHHDPSKDPAIYTSLLPRPGSNDNSWESLIEIDKTSETSKLQQLVDNIEHKLSDPNQCVVCHRVLSCKSALQMHYRTHTGERPFRCKICGRAFTTKGNLKTHMGVHRAKPPLRVLHQCPVCHRKFTNSLVLQQHIRLHTGEPTDLTPEQIQAAEIHDFAPPPPVSTSAGSYPNSPFLSHPPPLFPPLTKNSTDESQASYPLMLNMEQTCKDEEQYSPPFSCTSLAALENQVRTVTTMAAQRATVNGHDLAAPQRSQSSLGAGSACSDSEDEDTNGRLLLSPSPSPTPVRSSCGSPSAESSSLGALDLTPRSTAAMVTTTYTTTPAGGYGLLPPPPPPQPSFGGGGTFSPAAVAVLAGYNAASHPALGPAGRPPQRSYRSSFVRP